MIIGENQIKKKLLLLLLINYNTYCILLLLTKSSVFRYQVDQNEHNRISVTQP
jgi:hypothetical protein